MSKSAKKSDTPAEIPPQLAPLPNTTLAFCDGACKINPGKGGFGTVIISPNGEQLDIYGGEDYTTNNRMELMGAISALAYSPPQLPIQIWTDSGYVKDGITKWLAGWKSRGWKKADKSPVLNQELWQQLDQACQHRVITWHWLKGHAGHEGNEYADTLANLGVSNLPTPITIKKKPLNSPLSNNLPQTTMNDNATNLSPEPTSMTAHDDLIGMIFSVNLSEYADQDLNSIHHNFDTDDESDYWHPNSDINQNNFEEHGFLQNNVSPNNAQPSVNFDHQSLDKLSEQNPASAMDALFQDNRGVFVAQSDELIAKRPAFDGNTQTPNVFIPLLPLAKNHNVSNRQLIMDTETTGFEATGGDRIIEIGIVELINRKPTGEKLHVYINPNKEMDEDVIRVHGITNAFLADKPTFDQIGQVVYDFMLGAELVAHNAPFDMGFLVAEFNRLGLTEFANLVTVTDSLVIAKQQYAGQRNTLDALVKRLNVGKQDRTFHGALLDAEILAEVYLAMTGGQVSLGIDDSVGGISGTGEHQHFSMPVAHFVADASAEHAHLAWITKLKDQHPALLERWSAVSADEAPIKVD